MLPEKVEQRLKQRTAEYENLSYIPVEVTIKLSSPIIAPIFPLYFDALLANIVAQEIWGEYYGRIPNELFIEELPLPLKKHDFKEFGFAWAASCNVISKEAVFSMDGYKRTYPGNPWVLMKSFTASQLADYEGVGKYKNYLETFEITFTDEMKFYAVGDIKEIRRLLSQVKFLFKKRSQGRGEVQSITVSPIKQDFTLWKNGRPMRPIPIGLIKGKDSNDYRINVTRIQPPYWRRDKRILCIEPDFDLWSGRNSLLKRKTVNQNQKRTDPYELLYDE